MATVSIADQLKVLTELQRLDTQIYELKRERTLKPAEAARLKAEVEQFAQQVRKVEEEYKSLEIRRNQMEMELGQKETQIKKLQGQLFQVKTNKEYSAMSKEIEGFRADKSVMEEEILKFMEETDQIKVRLTVQREELEVRQERLAQTLTRLEEETEKIQSSLQKLESQRAVVVPRMEPPILLQYDRILANKEGLALVPVRGQACGGCFMVLPPQTINEIQIATRLVTCESCARLLYFETSG